MGRLVLCGTPIGNLDDVTLRALRVLREADVIACEDTRRTRKLMARHGLPVPELIVLNEATERRRASELVARVRSGATVVLVSDAGMPGISDPGYRLVRECIDADLSVEVVPGPSAVTSALIVSGLPPARYAFEGFLPRRPGDRRRRIVELRGEVRTLVLFVSPHRLEDSLADLLEVLGDRPAALARELTKLHEEVRRGPLAELLAEVRRDPPRGEMVLVVGGAGGPHRSTATPTELAHRAHELMERGVERSAALTEVARSAGVPRRTVFDALVERRASE
jgi:16S rRNA (cytidine1402-2'-O)-methyltransferase